MKIEKLENNIAPKPNSLVQFKKTGNVYELKYSKYTTGGRIRRISRNNYINLSTGEIREFKHTISREENIMSVSQSLKKLKDLINTNVTNPAYCRWVTLTYRDNMKDPKRLYNDFRKYNNRLRYHLQKYAMPLYEYIVAMEPQARGAWHAHVLMIFNENVDFIPNDVLAKIWKQGFVSIKSLNNVDNLGLYLTAYLGDMELFATMKENIKITNFKEVIPKEPNETVKSKYYAKGARLCLYPTGFRIYRKSKGIKEPTIMYCTNAKAMEELDSARLAYEKTLKISEGDHIINIINYRTYVKT